MDLQKNSCADCGIVACRYSEKEKMPPFCITKQCTEEEIEESIQCYKDKENNTVMQQAAILQAETYGKLTRVEETIQFANWRL